MYKEMNLYLLSTEYFFDLIEYLEQTIRMKIISLIMFDR